jgi:hypothetical protein
MSSKKAADRTISFLDGKTDEERQREVERIKQGLDIVEQPKEPVTIEQSADRWRSTAFAGQEFLTNAFGDPGATESQYRVTLKNGMCYLESCGVNPKSNGAYSYAGVMIPEKDLPRYAQVIVMATRAFLKRNKGIE